jgi:hypothetical protein
MEGDFTTHDFSREKADAVILIGALVHIPHGNFPRVLEDIACALKPEGLMLITVKEGVGRISDPDGRIFYLYRDGEIEAVFASLGFRVVEFGRNESETGTGEIWLRYILKKERIGKEEYK